MSNMMKNDIAIKIEKCPQCGAEIPKNSGYIDWCDQCNWNIQPLAPDHPPTLLESLYLQLGKKFSWNLFENISNLPMGRPSFSISRVFAFVLAGLVHSISLLFVVGGVLVLIENGLHFFSILLAMPLFLLAWLGLPRFAKEPENIIAREEFPTLYNLLDTISNNLGGKKIDGVVITPDFNAAFSQIGLSRKSMVFLGLPLFCVLDEQEKVALLAHEIAHGVNGDPLRSYFTATAVNTLVNWAYISRPAGIWQPFGGDMGCIVTVFMVPVNLLLLGISNLFLATAYGLMYLIFRDSQRAEYFADNIATTVCGTGAMQSMLEKLYLRISVNIAIQWVALTEKGENIYSAIQNHVSQIPAREIERLKRVNLLEDARIDTTHPPTIYRIHILNKHPWEQIKVRLSSVDSEKINTELRAMEEAIQKKMVSAYLQSLQR